MKTKTSTGSINGVFGMNDKVLPDGSFSGGSTYLQLDGSYGPNSVPSIEFTPEVLKRINSMKNKTNKKAIQFPAPNTYPGQINTKGNKANIKGSRMRSPKKS